MFWMKVPDPIAAPYLAVFRLVLDEDAPREIAFEYSADEFVQLFLDGGRLAEGPERGAPTRYFKRRVTLSLAPGRHILTARLGAFGGLCAANTISLRHGFYCSLGGDWRCRIVENITFEKPWPDWGIQPRVHVTAKYDSAILAGAGDAWLPVEYFEDGRLLCDSGLPEQLYCEERNYQRDGNRIVFDHYCCVWAVYRFRGHGSVRLRWAETGYLHPEVSNHTLRGEKGRRDGSFFYGNFDTFEVDGELLWYDIQWRAGKYLQIECTGDAEVAELAFFRTGYPYGAWKCDGAPREFTVLLEMAKRTLECCSHDSFIDCPYYERLMYIGDARLEALGAYSAFGDFKLGLHALKLLAASQRGDGAILSRYPARVDQMIGAFILNYLMMLHDYLLWSDDRASAVELLPVARRAAEYLESRIHDGLFYPEGWNFIDWQWPSHGVPYGSESGTNSILNLLAALAFRDLAEVERYVGEALSARRDEIIAEKLYERTVECFFVPEKHLFSDDAAHCFYSEHAQVLACLYRVDHALVEAMNGAANLTSCGIFFAFYYFEMCHVANRRDLFLKKLGNYTVLPELGLQTLPEHFSNSRSDCHAWSSHFLYHYRATWLGCRPCPLSERRRHASV